MKTNITKTLFFLVLLACAAPAVASEKNPDKAASEMTSTRAVSLQNRLNEINALDKASLSHAEKKVLRREVRQIKKELAAISGGVYLSVGAIILIALLLILLL